MQRIVLGVAAMVLALGAATDSSTHAQAPSPADAAQAVVDVTCRRCHNDRLGAKNSHRCLSC